MKLLVLLLINLLILKPELKTDRQKNCLQGKWELIKLDASGKDAAQYKTLWNPQMDYYGLEITGDNKFRSYQFKMFDQVKWEAKDEGQLNVKGSTFFFSKFDKYEHKRSGNVVSHSSHCGSGEFYCHPSFMEPWEHQPYIFKPNKKSELAISLNDNGRKLTWRFKKVTNFKHPF